MLTLVSFLQGLKPAAPETVWPTSVFGWIVGLSALVGFIILLRKSNNDPILRDISRVETEMKDIVAEIKKDIQQSLSLHDKRVEDKINGWAGRIENNSKDVERIDQAVILQAQELIRSQEDRRRINERQVEINIKLETLASQMSGLETRMRDKLDSQTKEIMTAIHHRLDKPRS